MLSNIIVVHHIHNLPAILDLITNSYIVIIGIFSVNCIVTYNNIIVTRTVAPVRYILKK